MKRRRIGAIAATAFAVLAATACGGNSGQVVESVPVESATQATLGAESDAGKEDVAQGEALEAEKGRFSQEDPSEYLKTYFDVEIGQDVDAASFSENLKKVAGGEAPAIEGGLTWMAALDGAVKAADYEELALSYPEEKAQGRLEAYGIEAAGLEGAQKAVLACALDVSLVTEADGKRAAAGEAFTPADEGRLLMQVADANGDGRNYLGMASDPDIYGKLDQAWNSFILFDDSQLSQVGKAAVEQGITTGYGIKSSAYDARFLPDLTLQYGHSDMKHARQLMGLSLIHI